MSNDAMVRREVVAWGRSFFKHLPRHVVRWAYTDTDWYGMMFPGDHSHTVVVNLGNHVGENGTYDWDKVCGTLLHELIHVEQMRRNGMPDHGAYFVARREELMALSGFHIPPGTPT